MTIQELIEILKQYPPETKIMCIGQDCCGCHYIPLTADYIAHGVIEGAPTVITIG